MSRTCSRCKEAETTNTNGWCAGCRRKARHARQQKDPEKYRNKINAHVREVVNKRRAYLNEVKSKPCADCGIQYNPWVMQFDHIRDKEFTISDSLTKAWDKTLAELEKCEVVCANCHMERTHRRRSMCATELTNL